MLASIFLIYFFIIIFNEKLTFLLQKFPFKRLSQPLYSAKAQDLSVAVDVCIKSQEIHAPLWQAWMHVHGEAQ
jgi:hypothetical protein